MEMRGDRRSDKARRLKTQPTSGGRPSPWGNSRTVISFSRRKRRSHPLEEASTASVGEAGQHWELTSIRTCKTRCDLQSSTPEGLTPHQHLIAHITTVALKSKSRQQITERAKVLKIKTTIKKAKLLLNIKNSNNWRTNVIG